MDSIKTELARDPFRGTRSLLELAIVEYLGWCNTSRLHGALGDIPPADHEALAATRCQTLADNINISQNH